MATFYEEPDFTMLSLPGADHDYVEVIGPGAEGTEFHAATYTTGPVVAFVVGDLVAARSELQAVGTELLDEITWSGSIPGYGWFHFRGPDGNVYAMMQGSRLRPEPHPSEPPGRVVAGDLLGELPRPARGVCPPVVATLS